MTKNKRIVATYLKEHDFREKFLGILNDTERYKKHRNFADLSIFINGNQNKRQKEAKLGKHVIYLKHA